MIAGIGLKKIAKALLRQYLQHSFVCCGKLIEPELSDETIFKLGTYGGIYDNNRSEWFPHYDIEYKCYHCGYYEHYTHDADGTILAMTIINVIFDFTTNEFGVIENKEIIPVGQLPASIQYNSMAFQVYFRKILEKTKT